MISAGQLMRKVPWWLGEWTMTGVLCVQHLPVRKRIKKLHKKPQITVQNKEHVENIQNNKGVVEISIPMLIDNYNNWIGRVDLVDQLIAYYHPTFGTTGIGTLCSFRCFP